uniref:Nuclear pore complex protein n=1 Tax=Siphoviridae sp. ctL0q1 TaxID=2825449 RepID=A0A8S5PKB0_9CAUD|nr:MAG TPA: Nuclear pore complex protein [Siphoviridae sp. ctL0q1]
MIFKTIDDNSTLSGQRIVNVFEARKIAQDKLTASLKEQSVQLEIDRQELSLLEQKVKSGMTYEQAYAESIKKASAAAKEHAVSTKGVSGATDTFVAKQKKAQTELQATATSSKVAAVGVKALKLAFNMFSGLVISFAISKIIEGFQYLAESAERAKEKLEDIRTDLTTNRSSYESDRKTLEGLKDEYDSLTKKADELGGVQNLTNEEYQRYAEIMSQILGITPKLITGWDDEGNAISNKNSLLQQSIDLLDEEYEKSLRNNTTKSKNEDVANGIITELNEFENSADTTTASGTMWKMREDFVEEIENLNLDYSDLEKLYDYLFPDRTFSADKGFGTCESAFRTAIEAEDDYEKLAKSFVDKDNPIYNLFSDEVIDNMIENANEYFQELDRIQDDRETYYQKYKDQLNWNAQAAIDGSGQNVYKQLSDESKSAITEYIDSLDYASVKTSDDFLAMTSDVKSFVKTLASDGTFSDYINDIYAPQGDDESIEDYSQRVKDAIANVQKYIKDNNLSISLDFGTEDDPKGVQKIVDDLQKSYDDAISSAKEKYNITMSEDNLSAVEYYNEATESAEKYRNSLDDIYKSYNGINNIDRDIIYWDDESLEKYKRYIDSWGESAEDLRNSWSTVLGTSENIDGVEVAFTAMLQTDHGLVPLEQDTFWQYFDEIFNQSWNEDGTFDAEKFIQLDKEGTDMIINGQMEHVANMIAAAEGQYMNGVKLTADDVIAIGTPGYDKNGKDLMPDNNSKYKGKSMHEVQEWALENRYALAQLDEQAKKTNTSVNGLIAEAGKYDGNTDWDSWFAENVHTQEDIDNWRKIQQSCNDATEAKKKYLETDTPEKPPVSTITSSVKQIATQLEPQFKQLGEAYKNIFTENGFTLDNVDNEMLENLRKSFGEIEAEVGVAFDTSQLNSFFDVLTNGKSTASQVQQEFNNLATSYLYSTKTLKSLNESTANSVAKQLEELGVTNSLDLVVAALASKNDILAASKITLAETGFDVANATTEEILAFIGEQNEASVTGQVLAYLQLQKQLVNNTMLDTAADINNIIALAEAAGMTTESLYKLESAKSLFESAKKTGDHMMEQKALQDMQTAYSSVQNTVANWKPTANYKGIGGGKSAASKAGSKSETDEYLENFEKMQDKLKDLYDQGKITTKQYYDALRALAEKYLKDREKYADKLAEIEQEYAKGMKELYDTVISGIISKIDKRISALNDQKDAAVSALEAEEEAAKKVLEAQKEALQVEIDAIDKQISAKQELIDSINDEADAKQRAYDLDKAQYELDRLRNQKTIYEYSGKEKGFIYKTDDKAIRDQEQEVDDKKREIRIANIEKEISALEKRKSALEEQQNAIDDQIDAISDYYEELIANTEAYWDEIIKGMEETKTKWEELQELQENAELEMNLRSLGYEGGIDEVLALTDEQFAQFKNNYLQYIAGMNQGNQSFIDSLSQISGVDIGNLPDIFKETQEYIDMLGQGIDFTNLDASLSGVISGFTKIADEAGIATGAIIGGTATTSANSSGNKNGAQGENGQSSSGSGDSLNGGIKTMSEESVPKINEVANAFAGSEEGEDTGTSVAGSAQKASKAISSGKDSGGEEDESLQGAIKTQVEAAVDPDKGLPAEQKAWSELDSVIASIAENLERINTEIDKLANKKVGNIFSGLGISIGGGAQVDGTAFASGTLGKVSDNGVALGGELGREMVVRNGRFFTVGDNGAELFHHKKGDIIFNHKQTQDILKNGHTNSRGKAFAGGNVSSLPKEYSLPSQEVMDRMAKLEAGFNSLNRDESLLVQMQIRDNTKKIYEQNARAIQEVQKYNKSNSTSNTYNYSIDAIELPNVMNGEDFYRDIRRLNTLIKQQGSTRK